MEKGDIYMIDGWTKIALIYKPRQRLVLQLVIYIYMVKFLYLGFPPASDPMG